MAYENVKIINPARPRPKKKKKAKPGKQKKHNNIMAKKKKSRTTAHHGPKKRNAAPRKRRSKKRNAATYVYASSPAKRSNTGHHKSHKRHRKRKNPDVPANYDPTKGQNILEYVGGTAAGALATPVLGNLVATNLNITGVSKYLVQLATAVVVYMFGKKYMPKAALAYLIGAVAVTMYQYFHSSGLIAGTEQLLGMATPARQFSAVDMNNFNRMAANIGRARGLQAGMVPMLRGIVSNSTPVRLDNRVHTMADGSRGSM